MLDNIVQNLRVFKLMIRSFVFVMYSCPGIKIITKKKLIEILKGKKRSNCCVVFGSGSSAIDTIDHLKRNDVKYDAYTANFGVYLPVTPILATQELATDASYSENVRSRILLEGIKIIQKKGTLVLFKNLQHDRVERRYLSRHYNLTGIVGVLDISLDQSFSDETVMRFVGNDDGVFLVQYINSIYTLVHLAELAGYDEIIVSGIDGGGKHFYIDNLLGMDAVLHHQLVNIVYPDEGTAIGHHAKSIRQLLCERPLSIKSSKIKVM